MSTNQNPLNLKRGTCKYFGGKRRKNTFFNCIFGLYPYRFTQISSVGTHWIHD